MRKIMPSFATGALVATAICLFAVQPRAVAESYQSGRSDAAHDIMFAGYMLYLGCLSDNCETQRLQQEAVVKAANDALLKAPPNEG